MVLFLIPAAYGIDDTDQATVMIASIEEKLSNEAFTSIQNASICIRIQDDEIYSFLVEIKDGIAQVPKNQNELCSDPEQYDFIINFKNFNSFKKLKLTTTSLILNRVTSFDLWPSIYLKEGGDLIINDNFIENYCPFIRNNLNFVLIRLYGLSDCITKETTIQTQEQFSVVLQQQTPVEQLVQPTKQLKEEGSSSYTVDNTVSVLVALNVIVAGLLGSVAVIWLVRRKN